ncbi:MAG: indolepyruvate oxidoreductase subunit beta [Oscillospiraceae bacterium]|jgi:indolepyruvate ferredoxin oxidoreductase beta subunit|nr:indolepyruvate oxidoreductase subunit beta [Oscillospiraceae bacterium]
MSTMSCLLCGVGGQGTVLASRLIAQTAMRLGYFARTAETIGMAQRGGSVVSHVRWSRGEVHSPLIPPGEADVLIGFEPGEAVRCIDYLKPNGFAVVGGSPIPSVLAALSGESYEAEPFLAYIRGRVDRLIIIDGARVAEASGSAKSLNIALIGAACGALKFNADDIIVTLKERMTGNILDMNRRAFEIGASAAARGYGYKEG